MCSVIDNWDWKYSCATGVFMVISRLPNWGTPNIWSPCIYANYPATCFRFMNNNIFESENLPCSSLGDNIYAKRGCVWGHGFLMSQNRKVTEADMFCDRYHRIIPEDRVLISPEFYDYLSCLDGYYHNSNWIKDDPDFETSCYQLPFVEAKELCLSYCHRERTLFNAKEDPWFNWELSENFLGLQ